MGKNRYTQNQDYFKLSGSAPDGELAESARRTLSQDRRSALHAQKHKHEVVTPPIVVQTASGPRVGEEPAHRPDLGFGAPPPAVDGSGFAMPPAAERTPHASRARGGDGAGATATAAERDGGLRNGERRDALPREQMPSPSLDEIAAALRPASLAKIAWAPLRFGLRLGVGIGIALVRAARRRLARPPSTGGGHGEPSPA